MVNLTCLSNITKSSLYSDSLGIAVIVPVRQKVITKSVNRSPVRVLA